MERHFDFSRKYKKNPDEERCFQAWISFFTILNTLPKLEYPRYTEGFFLSVRKTSDVSLKTFVSIILDSPALTARFKKSIQYMGPQHTYRLLRKVARLWPKEQSIIRRLMLIIRKNPAIFEKGADATTKLSPDLSIYLLTGIWMSKHIENFSKKAPPITLLEKVGAFPLVKRKLNS